MNSSPNRIVASVFNIVPQDLIITSKTTITTTVTQWEKLPISGEIKKRELADLTTPSESTSIADSSSASSVSSPHLEGITAGDANGGSSKIPLIMEILIPTGATIICIAVLIYWYFYVYRKKGKEHEWEDKEQHHKHFVAERKLEEDPFRLETPRSVYRSEVLQRRSDPPSTSSASLSTLSVPMYHLSRGKLEGKNDELEDMFTKYRVKHLAPIQHMLVRTPNSAIRRFFNRRSMAATKEDIVERDTLPKPQRVALKTLKLVDRLGEVHKYNAGSNKENESPQLVKSSPFSRVPILRDPSICRRESEEKRRREKQEEDSERYRRLQKKCFTDADKPAEPLVSDSEPIYDVVVEYEAHLPDEIDLHLCEKCIIEMRHDDGWCLVGTIDNNRRILKRGMVPMVCLNLTGQSAL